MSRPTARPLIAAAALLLATTALAVRPSFKLEGTELILPSPIAFAEGTDTLSPESEAALEYVKAYLTEKSYISQMRVEGHVAGAGAKDQALSEKRALAVARWLASHGVDCGRLVAVGFGNTRPVAEGGTPEGRARNNRVAFFNAALKGRPIGGMPVDGGGKVAGDACAK
jgi:OOP family OmpA-OmpF porin